jgi:hypothetical protein
MITEQRIQQALRPDAERADSPDFADLGLETREGVHRQCA